MRSNYWSCSKFADWLRGTAKPQLGSSAEWKAWEKAASIKKIRYWLAEEGLDRLQDMICWPTDRLNAMRNYLNCRYIWKSHGLISTLPRGECYDLDTRLLYAIFDELVNFVEVEVAWMHVACLEQEERKKYHIPWHRSFLRLRIWQNPEAGLAHLNWAAGLVYDETMVKESDPNFGKPTPQALAAQEIQLLYRWWKHERPHRPDPDEVSGWERYCENKHNKKKSLGDDVDSLILEIEDSRLDPESSRLFEICRQMKNEQDEEDTQMLIRLIKIRHHLWT